MCEANAYLIKNGKQELIISIFGDQKFIKGTISSLSLVDHKIFIQNKGA